VEEDLLRNCCFLLHDIVLYENVFDRWKWLPNPIKGYLSAMFIRCLPQ